MPKHTVEPSANTNAKQPIKLCDHPILAYFVIAFCTMLIFSVFNAIGYFVFGQSGTVVDLYNIVSLFPAAFLANLFVNKVFFRGAFDGPFGLDGFADGAKIFVPVLILDIVFFVFDRVTSAGGQMNDLLHVIAISLTAGIAEEMIFRANVLPNFMRLKRDYKGMVFSVVFTGVLFGLVHVTNLTSGADFMRTIQQVVTATITGLLFAGSYLMSGTILPCILIHTIHDIINLLFEATTESGALTGSVTTIGLIEQVIFSAVELGLAIWCLRPASFDKIRAIWDKKWNM